VGDARHEGTEARREKPCDERPTCGPRCELAAESEKPHDDRRSAARVQRLRLHGEAGHAATPCLRASVSSCLVYESGPCGAVVLVPFPVTQFRAQGWLPPPEPDEQLRQEQ
jgi:hypothetical protein